MSTSQVLRFLSISNVPLGLGKEVLGRVGAQDGVWLPLTTQAQKQLAKAWHILPGYILQVSNNHR